MTDDLEPLTLDDADLEHVAAGKAAVELHRQRRRSIDERLPGPLEIMIRGALDAK